MRLRSLARAGAVACLCAGLVPAGSPAGADAGPVEATRPISWDVHADPRLIGTEVGSVSTSATDAGASMDVSTNGLPEGRTYTVWIIFANNPDACRYPVGSLRCSMADGFNPDVDMHAIYCDGFVSTGASVTHTGSCFWPSGVEQTDPKKVFEGTGLLSNPRGAEYHAQLMDHGVLDEGRYGDAQTTTVDGGCQRQVGGPPDPAGYPCHPVQGNHFPTRDVSSVTS